MVKLTVYSSTGDFDLSTYFNVDKRVDDQAEHYYTSTDIVGATLYSVGGGNAASPLYFGHTTLGDGEGYSFEADGRITGRIGDDKLSDWLAGRDLADYTPETLVARIFVGDDHVRGNAGNDTLNGYAGNDTLLGGMGNDTLLGNVGDDVLTGGFGADTLTGGFGADRFVYRELHDIIGNGDSITDFSHADGDKIDLTGFDASVKSEGLQTVAFLGEGAFTAAGVAEVRVQVESDTVNLLQFDTNGDGKVDASISVTTSTVLDETDFFAAPNESATRVGLAAFGSDHATVVHMPHFVQPELATGHLA